MRLDLLLQRSAQVSILWVWIDFEHHLCSQVCGGGKRKRFWRLTDFSLWVFVNVGQELTFCLGWQISSSSSWRWLRNINQKLKRARQWSRSFLASVFYESANPVTDRFFLVKDVLLLHFHSSPPSPPKKARRTGPPLFLFFFSFPFSSCLNRKSLFV